MRKLRPAFTIVELLVVVSIIALLVSILLPAVGKARDAALLSQSTSNLRNLHVAHMSYANEWQDHQFTLIPDSIASYGSTAASAISAYEASTGDELLVWLGWGPNEQGFGYAHWILVSSGPDTLEPISFTAAGGSGGDRFGTFRILNVEAFHDYLSGRFYEPAFYAPKDTAVWASVQDGFETPYEYQSQGYGNLEWSSYCMSPAAMYHPQVFRRPSEGGWQNPWSIDAGFRSPSMAQARFSDLKTHMAEHNWLQNRGRNECNPAFEPGTYDGCEPWYFNASQESQPMFAFYDGHTEGVGIREAERADGRMRAQSGGLDGLWSRDTFWGEDGYYIEVGYDFAATSLHIFTTDGIRGRDVISQ
jgi:prepilin-type N-terminal cleavage/methylation domain-containing protein